MPRQRSRSAIAVLVFLSAVPVWAGLEKGTWEIAPYGGVMTGDNNENVDNATPYGLRIGYQFSPRFQVSFIADRFNTNRQIIQRVGDPSLPASQKESSISPKTTFMAYAVGLNSVFLVDRDIKTKPYFDIGLGFVTEDTEAGEACVDLSIVKPRQNDPTTCADFFPDGTKIDPNSNADPNGVGYQRVARNKDTGTLLTAAVGARSFIGRWFAFRYEIRYFHHDTRGANQDAFEATVGASFVLGRRQ